MSAYQCPRCEGPMDPGGASCSKGYFLFKSDSQDIRDKTTPISRALADPVKLRRSLGQQ